jgi:hypothetical protein
VLVTVAALVITVAVLVAIPLVLVKAWRLESQMPFALAWTVTALFAVQEMWMAEYRLGMAKAWKSAYSRCIAECQNRQLPEGNLEPSEKCNEHAVSVSQPESERFHPQLCPDLVLNLYRSGQDYDDTTRMTVRKYLVVSSLEPEVCHRLFPWLYLEHLTQTGIPADSLYNFNTQAGPTPSDFI